MGGVPICYHLQINCLITNLGLNCLIPSTSLPIHPFLAHARARLFWYALFWQPYTLSLVKNVPFSQHLCIENHVLNKTQTCWCCRQQTLDTPPPRTLCVLRCAPHNVCCYSALHASCNHSLDIPQMYPARHALLGFYSHLQQASTYHVSLLYPIVFVPKSKDEPISP